MSEQAPETQATKDEDKAFQAYTSRMDSMKMITQEGIRIHFVHGRHITDNQDVMDYLDYEIEKGNRFIKKGDKVTSKEANPMAGLIEKTKREAIAEYLAKEQAELEAGNKVVPDIKVTTSESTKDAVKPISAEKLAGIGVNKPLSNS